MEKFALINNDDSYYRRINNISLEIKIQTFPNFSVAGERDARNPSLTIVDKADVRYIYIILVFHLY